MNIGLTFDEKILKYRIFENWLEIIADKGASFIEMSPHPSVLDLKVYHAIANKASNLNMDLHFHVPYFADMESFTFDWSIINRQNRLDQYFKLLDWLASIKTNNATSYLVVHGTPYKTNQKNAMNTTLRFTDRILNQIINKNYPIKILYETLSIDEGKAIGNNWDELYTLCKEFDTDQLKICWDVCHDLRNHDFKTDHLKEIDFGLVPYAHIHGFDSIKKQAHVELSYNKSIFEQALLKSKEFGFNGPMNLEHLIYACGDQYEEIVLRDLEWMGQISSSQLFGNQ